MSDLIKKVDQAWLQPSERFIKRRAIKAAFVKAILFGCASLSVLVTLGILYVLLSESWAFFREISILEF